MKSPPSIASSYHIMQANQAKEVLTILKASKLVEFLPLMHNHHDGWNETTLILYKKKQ